MPITTAFTVTAMVAVILHLLYFRRLRTICAAYRASGRNGLGAEVGRMLIRTEFFRLFKAALLLAAGVGVLGGFRPAAYLIAVVPIASIISSAFDLREPW